MAKDHMTTHEIAEYMLAHTDNGKEQHGRCIVCQLYELIEKPGLAERARQELAKLKEKRR